MEVPQGFCEEKKGLKRHIWSFLIPSALTLQARSAFFLFLATNYTPNTLLIEQDSMRPSGNSPLRAMSPLARQDLPPSRFSERPRASRPPPRSLRPGQRRHGQIHRRLKPTAAQSQGHFETSGYKGMLVVVFLLLAVVAVVEWICIRGCRLRRVRQH